MRKSERNVPLKIFLMLTAAGFLLDGCGPISNPLAAADTTPPAPTSGPTDASDRNNATPTPDSQYDPDKDMRREYVDVVENYSVRMALVACSKTHKDITSHEVKAASARWRAVLGRDQLRAGRVYCRQALSYFLSQ